MRDRQGAANRLVAGTPGLFQVQGVNASSAAKTFQLGFSVAGKSCGNSRSTFVTDDNGGVTLSGVTPKTKVKVSVVATVFYQGAEVSSAEIKIKPKGKGASARSKIKQPKRQRICQELLAFN